MGKVKDPEAPRYQMLMAQYRAPVLQSAISQDGKPYRAPYPSPILVEPLTLSFRKNRRQGGRARLPSSWTTARR